MSRNRSVCKSGCWSGSGECFFPKRRVDRTKESRKGAFTQYTLPKPAPTLDIPPLLNETPTSPPLTLPSKPRPEKRCYAFAPMPSALARVKHRPAPEQPIAARAAHRRGAIFASATASDRRQGWHLASTTDSRGVKRGACADGRSGAWGRERARGRDARGAGRNAIGLANFGRACRWMGTRDCEGVVYSCGVGIARLMLRCIGSCWNSGAPVMVE